MTAAVFVLCTAVWAAWRLWPQGEGEASANGLFVSITTIVRTSATHGSTTYGSTATTTAPITTAPTVTTTSFPAPTTVASSFSAPHTGTTTTITTEQIATHPSSVTSATTSSTTTAKSTTTTQSPKKTYPAAWDTVYRSTTEDNQPIEEVTWYYRPAGDMMFFDRLSFSAPPWSNSHGSTKTYRYDIPLSECIIITGFDAPTANGIYRVPAAIDGQVVVGVDMSQKTEGVCQFNDSAIAPTVKRLYLPPELMLLELDTINCCTALEAIYVYSHTLWLEPEALPVRRLYIYSDLCYMSCETWLETPRLRDYCYELEYQSGYTESGAGYYEKATWRSAPLTFDEFYG